MAIANFSPASIHALCEKLKVLADENRMKVFLLLRGGERCVCDIVDPLGLPQSLVSHHLAVMRNAGLLRDRRSGKWIYYSIDKQVIAELNEAFLGVFDLEGISTEPAPECGPDRCCGS